MRTIRNQIQLIGHVGRTPEVREFDNGKKLAMLSIATNEYFKNKEGEKVQQTNWHRLVGWGKVAELMENMINKGNKIAVQGKLANRSYTGKDGNPRYITEVVVDEFIMMEKPPATI